MIVGTEWLIEAAGCEAEKLRGVETLRQVFAALITDLELKIIGEEIWHKFEGVPTLIFNDLIQELSE